MKKIANLVFGRCAIVVLAILIQVGWLSFALYQFSYRYTYVNWVIRILAIILVLVILNRWANSANKLSWTFLILLAPVLGVLIYFLFGRSSLTKRTAVKVNEKNKEVYAYLDRNSEVMHELEKIDTSVYRQSSYVNDWADFPVYKNTSTKYFKCGEDMYPDMIADLKKAKHFIFLEYFIIEPGYMLDSIIEILEEKVKAGVEVRLIYDDVGCISTLPPKYYKILQAKGIKCAAFNPFRPVLSIIMNNRDHRKIFVVDGNVAYTGGINLADEYMNKKERFGYWKDTGVRMYGEAVWSFTLMFLNMWNYINSSSEDYQLFRPKLEEGTSFTDDGFVQPYGDSPLDRENVGENIYLNMINRAKKYVYIFTPYLIIDNELLTCLSNAAKSGVDVRIVTPGIPDKKMVYLLTQSYYVPLLSNGVKIYQYNPGFLHAKSFVCDDELAIVGSVNLDYRSLYLHFECGVWMYRSSAIAMVKEDADQTFAQSREVSLEECKKRPLPVRMFQSVLRLLAPLL